jgi:hypothetical protein
MAQTGYTPLLIYASGTASNVPLAANLTSSASGAELALNYADGKLYFKNSSGVVTLLASSAGASGDVVGPASATDNALARFDLTTGKLIQNSVGILSDAGVLTGLTGLTSSGNITLSALTSGRVPYASTGGLLVDSANLLFDGTTLTANALTTTSTVTINGGTANGVAYLNGSKVLTTGSALTFDGTNLNVDGGRVRAGGGSDEGTQLNMWTTPGGDGNLAAFQLIFNTGANNARTEQMRLNSTGLGIGTSSPAYKLDVSGSAFASNWYGPQTAFTVGTVGGGVGLIGYGSTGVGGLTNTLLFQANGEKMRLDSSGNLGIGTSSITPVGSQTVLAVGNSSGGTVAHYQSGSLAYRTSASSSGVDCFNPNATPIQWYTSGTSRMLLDSSGNLGLGVTPSAWQSGSAIQMAGGQGYSRFGVTNNAYYDGSNYRYVSTAQATLYGNLSGSHLWFNAPSGTAGNAITFTQAMTLDASGNLLVGNTSSTGFRAQIYGNGLSFASAGGYAGYIGQANIFMSTGAATDFAIRSDANLLFGSNGATERARITSGGDFYINTTGAGGKFYVVSDLTANNALRADAPASFTSNVAALICGTAAGTGFNFLYCESSGGSNRLNIRGDGNVYNANGTYGTISDVRLKQDISDAPSQWDDIKAVRFRKYRMKEDVALDENAPYLLGVVAQELEQTSPGLVDDGEVKTVKSSILLMKAAVALQEAMARIETLEAEVAALKGA